MQVSQFLNRMSVIRQSVEDWQLVQCIALTMLRRVKRSECRSVGPLGQISGTALVTGTFLVLLSVKCRYSIIYCKLLALIDF